MGSKQDRCSSLTSRSVMGSKQVRLVPRPAMTVSDRCKKCSKRYVVWRGCERCRSEAEPCDDGPCSKPFHLCGYNDNYCWSGPFMGEEHCQIHRDVPVDSADGGLCGHHRQQVAYHKRTLPSPVRAKCFKPGCDRISIAPPGINAIFGCRFHAENYGPDGDLALDPDWTSDRWTPKKMKLVKALSDMGLEGLRYSPEVEELPLIKEVGMTGQGECCRFTDIARSVSWRDGCLHRRSWRHVRGARTVRPSHPFHRSEQPQVHSTYAPRQMQHAFPRSRPLPVPRVLVGDRTARGVHNMGSQTVPVRHTAGTGRSRDAVVSASLSLRPG